VGKSAFVSHWMRQLDPRLYLPLALTQASLSGSGLLACLVQRLGKTHSFRREGNLHRIESALAELERRTPIIILDEAQNYSSTALEEIRLLLGLHLPERPLFSLLLIGDDYLSSSLQLNHQRALYSRLGAQHRLDPWTPAQRREYLETALRAASLSPTLLPNPTAEILSAASAGLPRSLQLLARAAWLHAAMASRQQILPEDAQAALTQVPFVPGLQTPHENPPT
jgi:type II secretory pathway predicted ATPase ExeA